MAPIPLPRPRPPEAPAPEDITSPAATSEVALPENDPILAAMREAGLSVPESKPQPTSAPQAAVPKPPVVEADPILDAMKLAGLGPPDSAPTEQDAIWKLAGKALIGGAVHGASEIAAGTRATAPLAIGGSTVAAEAAQLPPEGQDEISVLRRQPISVGWNDARWWAAKIAGDIGEMSPSMGMAVGGAIAGGGIGTAMGGPPGGLAGGTAGGIAGFSVGASLQTLVPAFQRGKLAGLSDDDAMTQAITESGLAGGFAAAMGILTGPTASFFGKELNNALKRPLLEAFTKIGIIVPAIGTIQQGTFKSIESGGAATLTPDEIITGWITNAVTGGVLMGAHSIGGKVAKVLPADPLASSTRIREAFDAAIDAQRADERPPPAKGKPLDEKFYVDLSASVDQHPATHATPADWMEVMRKGGAPAEDLTWLHIPEHLLDAQGRIDKTTLMQQIDMGRSTLFHAPNIIPSVTIPGKGYNSQVRQVGMYTGTTGQANIYGRWHWTERMDRDGKNTMFLENVELLQRPAGYKGDLLDLLMNVIIRDAANAGYERVALADGASVNRATKGALSTNQSTQVNNVFDNIIPKVMDKIADTFGVAKGRTADSAHVKTMAGLGQTTYGMQRYIDLNPIIGSIARAPGSSFSMKPGVVIAEHITPVSALATGGVKPVSGTGIYLPAELRPAARRVGQILEELRKMFKIDVPIMYGIHDIIPGSGNSTSMGRMRRLATGYSIDVGLSHFERTGAEHLYAVVAHEFGHVVMYHYFDKAPTAIKTAIVGAFNNWRQGHPPGITFERLGERRDSAVSNWYEVRSGNIPVLAMTPERQRYWNGFEEWFAEQTARWATTSVKPLNIVDRFFRSLGNRVRNVVESFRRSSTKFDPAEMGEPTTMMKSWLDSLIENPQPFAADIIARGMIQSQRANQQALNAAGTPHVLAVPQTVSTAGARGLINKLFGAGGTGESGAIAAGADRFNKFYEWMISLPQLAKLNPHIEGLQSFKNLMQMMHMDKVNTISEAEVTLGYWKALQRKQADAVAAVLDDYMNMVYLTAAERTAKVRRRPDATEFEGLVRKHGLSDKGVNVLQRVLQDFDRMIDRYGDIIQQGAHKIVDPVVSAQKLEDLQQQIDKMKKMPYFPAMRFGNYTVTVRDANGKVVNFQTAESVRARARLLPILLRDHPEANGNVHQLGYLEKDVAPLIGMPPGLLDKLAASLDLSPTQLARLDELKFDYLPAHSFAHRFTPKKFVPGYSSEFMRAYAHYFFHGANYFARARFVDQLRESIQQTKEDSKLMPDATKRHQIVGFMSDGLRNTLDPKADFTTLRSAMFTWALGFSPAAATLNLSQSILGTYPYLAQHFGDARTIAAMGRSSTKLSTFYGKRRLVDTTESELQGLREAMREGILTEAMAPQLAGTADGRILTKLIGGTAAEKAFHGFSRASSFMFETTEQYNRRVAFRTAWELAQNDPAAPHVANMVKQNQSQYQRLLDKGWSERDAAAFVTAKDAVESTQYIYAPYARPKFMRGKLGSLFVFKSFTQNTLFYLWNNKPAAARSLLILGAAGGMMGLPGMEDINGILRALAYHLFGKDFDLQDAARNFVVDVLHGGGGVQRPGDIRTGEGGIRPDILLHGLSRVGYGIPALMDMMGSVVGGKDHVPMPVVDRHQAIGMGNILPFDTGIVGAPQITGATAGGGQNIASAEIGQVQKASGAMFGLGFALYKFLESTQYDMNDAKRWEGIMPTALRNVSKAFRYYNEGAERNSTGAQVVRFDPNNPEHMMEIIAQAGGYRPERVAAYWDRMIAQREQEAFWDVRRQYLLRAAWFARTSGDKESYGAALEAIRTYNEKLPDDARPKAITADVLRKSFETRATAKAKTEADIPRNRQNIPLFRSTQRLYPEADAGR